MPLFKKKGDSEPEDYDSLGSTGAGKITEVSTQQIKNDDSTESAEDKSRRITNRDVIWPPRVDKRPFRNPLEIRARYVLSVINLDPIPYNIVAIGGQPDNRGGVLLDPGQLVEWEIRFTPPQTAFKPRNFTIDVTLFDISRANDPGESVLTAHMRWVPAPETANFTLANPSREVFIRPWRRHCAFPIRFANNSVLPAVVSIQLVRAQTLKELSSTEAEVVSEFSHSYAEQTKVEWSCKLPPLNQRVSYLATLRGKVRAAEQDYKVELANPVKVTYLPPGKVWTDYLYGTIAILALIWIIWGIPVQKTPVVRLKLEFTGKQPSADQLKKLRPTLTLLENEQPVPGTQLVTGVYKEAHGYYEFILPSRWYGYQFGWNIFSRKPQQYELDVVPSDDVKDSFSSYYLDKLSENDKWLTVNPAGDTSGADSAPLFRDWIINTKDIVMVRNGVPVRIYLKNINTAGDNPATVDVTFSIAGKPSEPVNLTIPPKHQYVDYDVSRLVGEGTSPLLMVSAKTDKAVSEHTDSKTVQHSATPVEFHLSFKPIQSPPGAGAAPPGPNPGPGNPPQPEGGTSSGFKPVDPIGGKTPGNDDGSQSPAQPNDTGQGNHSEGGRHAGPDIPRHTKSNVYQLLINGQWNDVIDNTETSAEPADKAMYAFASYEQIGSNEDADKKLQEAIAETQDASSTDFARQLALIASARQHLASYIKRKDAQERDISLQILSSAQAENNADSLALWYVTEAEALSYEDMNSANQLLERGARSHKDWQKSLDNAEKRLNSTPI